MSDGTNPLSPDPDDVAEAEEEQLDAEKRDEREKDEFGDDPPPLEPAGGP